MSVVERVEAKVEKIVKQCKGDSELIDERIDKELTAQEFLTIGLMPVNSKLRTFVIGCFIRAKDRNKKLAKLKHSVEEDDLVPIEIHGGGKCKITVFMTKEAADRERGR